VWRVEARCRPLLRGEAGDEEKNSASTAPRRLDRGDIDFLHFHHRIESAKVILDDKSLKSSNVDL
jgi:hypothetical protein